MTTGQAKQIGSRQGLKAAGIGLSCAQIIMTIFFSADRNVLKASLWFTSIEYGFNVIMGILFVLASGFVYGQRAGIEILVRQRNFLIVGLKYGFLTLLTGIFLTSWIGFFQEGMNSTFINDNPFYDYIFKPVYWVMIIGFIPMLLIGAWFGFSIKQRKTTTH